MLAAITDPSLLDLAGSSPDDLGLPGTIVDQRYFVEKVVGTGGFGVVFRARHVRFDSPVALKVLIRGQEAGRGSPDAMDASPVEGRLLSKLAPLHPAFVHVYDEGTVRCRARGTRPYLVMEWLDGVALRVVLELLEVEGRSLPLDTVLHLFDGLAQGLSVAHARRVAHRDLKPGNVFLAVTDGKVAPRLLDFGLAQQGSSASDLHDDAAPAICPFTPAYGAPEQWDRSLGATGPWTDVHALALILVELLQGGRWNAGASRSDMIRATLDLEHRPTPRSFGVNVSRSVDAVFERAFAVQPRERYPDVAEFWGELCRASGWKHPGTPLEAPSVGLTELGSDAAAPNATPRARAGLAKSAHPSTGKHPPPTAPLPVVHTGAEAPAHDLEERPVDAPGGPAQRSRNAIPTDRRPGRRQVTIVALVLLASASLAGLAALSVDARRGAGPARRGAGPARHGSSTVRPASAAHPSMAPTQGAERPSTLQTHALADPPSARSSLSAAGARAHEAPTSRFHPKGVALDATNSPTGTSTAAATQLETRRAGARSSDTAVAEAAARVPAEAAPGVALQHPMLTRK
jgi:serine/threonine protein kinase